MPPLVFISHSAKTTKALELLAKLEEGLKDRNWDVFVDRSRIAGGANWRNQIHTALAVCDAAVILFSEAAYRDSEWVLKEATIFSWRRELDLLQAREQAPDDPPFAVVPVLFPEVTQLMLSQKPYDAIRLGELKPVHSNDANIVETVHRALGPQRERSPLQRIEDGIAGFFRNIDAAVLRAAAEKLGKRLTWNPALSLHKQLARDLFHADWDDVNAALSELAIHMSASDIRTVISLLAPFSVNPLAVVPIPRLVSVQEAGKRPVIALNSKLQQTGEHYIQRARCHTDHWTVVPLANAGGGDMIGSLKRELLRYFEDPSDPDYGEAEMMADLERKHREGTPVFVLLKGPVETDVVDALRAVFPYCVFVLLAGSQWDQKALKDAGIELLVPALDPAEEEQIRQQIRDAREIAKKREKMSR
ncbi:MAG TPA: toll/interleukin-1 receptor domain-containing protein [Thermoanaerobaculia bacterium]